LIWSRKSQTFSESKVVILRFRSDYSDPTVWLFTFVKIIVLNSCPLSIDSDAHSQLSTYVDDLMIG